MRAIQKVSFAGGPPLRPYRCPMCGGWHLTSTGVMESFDIEYAPYDGEREDDEK